MRQFEIWWANLPAPAGRRPVLLLSRNDAYHYLSKFIVAETVKTRPGARTMSLDAKTGHLYLITAQPRPAVPGQRTAPGAALDPEVVQHLQTFTNLVTQLKDVVSQINQIDPSLLASRPGPPPSAPAPDRP